jgi:hypothetical protein
MKILCLLGMLYTTAVWGLSCSKPVTLGKQKANDFDCYYNSEISINNSGEAIVTWSGSAPGDQHILCSLRESDKQWSLPIIIKKNKYDWFENEIDEQGNITVYSDTLRIRKAKGSDWSSPEENLVDTSFPVRLDKRDKKVIIESSGKVFAAWIVEQRGWIQDQFIWKKTLQCSWLQEDQTWSDPLDICQINKEQNIFEFHVMMNSKGDIALFICYETQTYPNQTFSVQSVIYTQGIWSPIQEASTHFSPASHFSIDEEGNIAGIGEGLLNDDWVCSVVSKLVGQSWSSSQAISSIHVDGFYICNDNKGHFFVAWCEFEDKKGNIKGSVFSASENKWTTPVQLSPLGQDCRQPSCALNGKGEGLISWITQGDECELIQIAELNLSAQLPL